MAKIDPAKILKELQEMLRARKAAEQQDQSSGGQNEHPADAYRPSGLDPLMDAEAQELHNKLVQIWDAHMQGILDAQGGDYDAMKQVMNPNSILCRLTDFMLEVYSRESPKGKMAQFSDMMRMGEIKRLSDSSFMHYIVHSALDIGIALQMMRMQESDGEFTDDDFSNLMKKD